MKELTQEKPVTLNGLSHALDKGMVLLLVSAAMIGIVYFLAQSNERFLYVLSNGLPPLLAFAVFVVATAGLVHNGVRIKDRVSVAWLGYSLGMLLWLLAETTWAVYTLWYSIPVPFPSPADGFWLAGYVPLTCAIVIQVWPFREFLSSRKMMTVIATVLVLAGLLLAALIPPTYASQVGHGLVSIGISLAYPLLDVILLVFAFPIFFLFGRGTFWRPFLFVTCGMILTFLGDILFSWTTLSGVYYDGSFLELFFHWSYLMFAYGFYLRLRQSQLANMLE